MSNLDINTPKGRETAEEELKMAKVFQRNYTFIRYIHTDKTGPRAKAIIDGQLLCYDKILCLVEQKSRFNFTLEEFRSTFENRWLVTYGKIVKAELCCEFMQLPLEGFLWIVQSKCLLRKVIWTPEKKRIANLYTAETETKRTVNGGSIVRENAFIDMSDAEVIQ